jgi:hypothetical protein
MVFLTIPVAAILFLWFALQISKDEAAFQKLPPRLPNLLPILTGEQKQPRGLRNRINLIGDLVAAGMGLNMTFFFVGWYLQNHFRSEQFVFLGTLSSIGNTLKTLTLVLPRVLTGDLPMSSIFSTLWLVDGYALTTLMIVLTIIAYAVFALLFVGIPRKYRRGMIFLGSAILLIDLFVLSIYGCLYLFYNHDDRPLTALFITGSELKTFVLVMTVIAYAIFALFFAGIPRKRYWGMIFLGSSVLLIDALAILVVLPEFLRSRNEWKTVTGIVVWYLVWYILIGIAGLRVYCPRNSPDREERVDYTEHT